VELWILPAEEKIRADGPDWLLLILAECNPEMSDKFMLLLWRTWYVRNQIKPENAAMPTEGSKRFLESYFQSLFEVHQRPGSGLKRKTLARSVDFYKLTSVVGHDAPSRWMLPYPGRVKINVDAAVKNSGLTGIGIVARDDQGAVLLASEGKGFIWRSNGLIAQLH